MRYPPFPALAVPLLFGLAIWLLLAGGESGFILQFFLGKLAYSTSHGAALFLLAYGALAWVRLKLPGGAGPGWLPVFLATLAIGHAVNLWITLRYLVDMDIPMGAHAYHWLDDRYSFTGLFHSHLGKTAVAVLANAAGVNGGPYDTGAVFLPWVPAWAPWVIGAAFAFGLIASLLALPALVRRWPGKTHAVLFVLVTAVALRGMIDGGPMASGLPPAFAVLGWLVFYRNGWETGKMRYYPLMASLALLAYLLSWLSLSETRPALGGFLFPLCLYAWWSGLGMRRVRAVQWALAGLVAVFLTLDAEQSLLPMVMPQAENCRVVDLAAAMPDTHACQNGTPYAGYLGFGNDPRKPHTVLFATTEDAGPATMAGRILPIDAHAGQWRLSPSDVWSELDIAPMSLSGGWLAWRARASSGLPPIVTPGLPDTIAHHNFNVYLWMLMRSLAAGGLKEFVLRVEMEPTTFIAYLAPSR